MSSFILKIIAAVTMLIDHAGLILFPEYGIMRIIGRIAFPIYAYCIAEGFRYTRNRLHYFLRIFILGLICQIVYFVVDGDTLLGILLTFSLSILVMCFTDCIRVSMNGQKSPLAKIAEKLTGAELSMDADRVLSLIASAAVIAALFMFTVYFDVDYGFFGIMLPVFTNFFHDKKKRFVMFSAALLALCIDMTVSFSIQYWSLLTIPIIALYNGRPGKYKMKYFFYIFYPAHLVFLYALDMIL